MWVGVVLITRAIGCSREKNHSFRVVWSSFSLDVLPFCMRGMFGLACRKFVAHDHLGSSRASVAVGRSAFQPGSSPAVPQQYGRVICKERKGALDMDKPLALLMQHSEKPCPLPLLSSLSGPTCAVSFAFLGSSGIFKRTNLC